MSAILDQFETHINGFLELESCNFQPNYFLPSSIEAETITFLLKTKNFNMAPLPELIVRSQRLLIPKMVLLFAL